jgi:hypothetical protein
MLRMSVGSALSLAVLSASDGPLRAAENEAAPAAPRVASARVLTPDGQPVAGAKIEPYCKVRLLGGDLAQWSFGGHGHEQTTTDNEGEFTYAQPECDRVGVRVIAAGFARTMLEIPYGARVTDIVLGKGVTVTGRLLKDGQPVPDIEVGIVQVDHNSLKFLEEIVVKSDGDGRFILRDVSPHESYEIHGKRDSLKLLGVTGEIRVTTGEPESNLDAGDLLVEPGIRLTGRLMFANGEPATSKSETITLEDGSTYQRGGGPAQLHIYRESAYDFQYIDLAPDLRFTVLARENEQVAFSAWVNGYKLRAPDGVMRFRVKPGLKSIEMVYVPE